MFFNLGGFAMANGFACKKCGWQEIEHVNGARLLGLNDVQVKDRSELQPGFTCVLYSENRRHLYTLTDEEIAYDHKVARRIKEYSDGLIAINNMLA